MKKLLILLALCVTVYGVNAQAGRVYKNNGPHQGLVYKAHPTVNVEIVKTPNGGVKLFLLDKNDAEYKSTNALKAKVVVGRDQVVPLEYNVAAINGNEFVVNPSLDQPIIYYVVVITDGEKEIHARFVASDIK